MWTTGDVSTKDIILKGCITGEMSILWSEYLQRWIRAMCPRMKRGSIGFFVSQ